MFLEDSRERKVDVENQKKSQTWAPTRFEISSKNGPIFNFRLHITRQPSHVQNSKCAGLPGTRATPGNVLELFRGVPRPFRGLVSQFFEILKKAEIFAFM